jgi:hypothetical protein
LLAFLIIPKIKHKALPGTAGIPHAVLLEELDVGGKAALWI